MEEQPICCEKCGHPFGDRQASLNRRVPRFTEEEREAARQILEQIVLIVGKFPGWEPESLKLQPAMVSVCTLREWAATIRKMLEGK